MYVFGFFIVLAYLLPYHVYPYLVFFNEWLALLAVVVLVAAIANGRGVFAQTAQTDVLRLRVPWLVGLPLALVVWTAMQLASGLLTYPWDALLPMGYWLFAAVAIVVGASVSTQPLGAAALVRALVCGHLLAGLVSVLLASQQWLANEGQWGDWVMQMPHGGGIRPYANTGQPNQLALLFCLALASLWWCYQARLLRGLLASVAVVLLLWGLALTQSRIGWLIVPAFALCIGLWRFNTQARPIAWAWLGLMTLLYAGLVLLLPTVSEALGLDVLQTAMERAGQTGVRRVYFAQALRISTEHAWFGAGWFQFGAQQVAIGADFAASDYAQHAHNVVLNVAAEMGWPLTLAFFGALAWWSYRVFLRGGNAMRLPNEVAFAALCFIAVGVHSMVEFPLWYGYVLMPVALLLGVVHQVQSGAATLSVPRTAVLLLALLMALGLVGVANQYRQVVTGYRAFGWERLGLKADEGSSESPAFTIFPQFYDYFRFAKRVASANMLPEEIVWMERVAKRFGYAPVLMRMSVVYSLNNRPDSAVRTLLTLKQLHPGHYPEVYQSWQQLAVSQPDNYAAVFKQLPQPVPPSQP